MRHVYICCSWLLIALSAIGNEIDWIYEETLDDGIVLKGTTHKNIEELKVPSMISGKPVTKIADWAFACKKSLRRVIIPSSVKQIGDHAFYGCSISSIELAEGLKRIEHMAFSTCGNVSNVFIPLSVEFIGNEAFPSACKVSGMSDVAQKAEEARLVCYKLEEPRRMQQQKMQQEYAKKQKIYEEELKRREASNKELKIRRMERELEVGHYEVVISECQNEKDPELKNMLNIATKKNVACKNELDALRKDFEQDLEKANGGDAEAQFRVGEAYRLGNKVVSPNPKLARKFLRQSFDNGCEKAWKSLEKTTVK